MGLQRAGNITPEPEKMPLVKIIEKITAPVQIASKKYYQSNPKEALELGLMVVLFVITFIGQILKGMPWEWYAVLFAWVSGYHNLLQKLKTTLKKKK